MLENFIYSRLVFINKTELPFLLKKLLNPEFKGALLTSEDHLAYWNNKGFPKKYYTPCNSKLKTINLSIYMRNHSCLAAEISRQIHGLNANGFVKALASQYIDRAYLKERVIVPEPQKLQFHQLIGGFQLYAGGIIIGLGALVLEILYNWITKLFRKYSNRF